MVEFIPAKARNIYEQQKHNTRMTYLLISGFLLLFAIIGIGFDIGLKITALTKVIIFPFLVLMVVSGIWGFRKKVSSGVWEKPEEFADEDENYLFWLGVRITLVPMLFVLMLVIMYLNWYSISRFISKSINLSVIESLPVGTFLTIIIGVFAISTSMRWGKNSVLWSVKANTLDETSEDTTMLENVVTEMSLAAGIPRPSVYVVDDPDPNAFAVGMNLEDASVVVTKGLLSVLNREELQGVIAHEVSHIRNEDTKLMTTVTILLGAVVLLSGWLKKSAFLGRFAGSKIPGVGLILRMVFFGGWVITLLFTPLIARLLAMAISRQREYLADASAAELTRNPKALANALMKIEGSVEPTRSFHNAIAHLCIVDPTGKRVNEKESWWADLFATHPPMKKRIIYLKAMAYQISTA